MPLSLDMRTYAAFDGVSNRRPLPEICTELLSDQRKVWPDLELGYASLEGVELRDIPCNGFCVRVQHNPGRITSTLAKTGKGSTSKRPCFLCLDNLPEEQKGILYRKEYLVLCNPMPVFPGHFTIAHCTHQPQAIVTRIDHFLQIMTDFGSHWSILYNGPKCGASAPDHLHFQAIPSGRMPIEEETADGKRLVLIMEDDGVRFSRAKGLGRELFVLEGDRPSALAQGFTRIVTALRKAGPTDNEPMVSVSGSFDGEKWRVLVFPRAKHRPDAFFREGNDRIVVSPAIIEMGGVLVTPVRKDFDELRAPEVETIFREVSLQDSEVLNALDAMPCFPR